MEDWWDQAERHDGLLVTGRPYCGDSDEIDFDFGGMDHLLLIRLSFMAAFAIRCQDDIMDALEPTEKAAHEKAEVRQPAGQAANVVLHRCVAVQAAHFSLLCFVPEVTKRVAEAIDMRVVKAFSKINDLGDEETNQHDTQVAFACNARRHAPPEASVAGRHGTRGKLDAIRRPSCGTGGRRGPTNESMTRQPPMSACCPQSSGRSASGDGDQRAGNRGNNMPDDALVLPTQSPESDSDEPGDHPD